MNRKKSIFRTGFQIRDHVKAEQRSVVLHGGKLWTCACVLSMWWSDVLMWSKTTKDSIVNGFALYNVEKWMLGIRRNHPELCFVQVIQHKYSFVHFAYTLSKTIPIMIFLAMWPIRTNMFWWLEHKQNRVIQRESRGCCTWFLERLLLESPLFWSTGLPAELST